MKTTFQAQPNNSNATNFRAWGKGLSDALQAVGLTNTTDTGQIDWGTVAAPTSTYQYMGYEIYRFNDALQATTPCCIKIEYGSGASASYCAFRITVGRATDGAGSLTGPTTMSAAPRCNSLETNLRDCYVAAGDGWVGFFLFVNTTSSIYSIGAYVARFKDSQGSNIDAGIQLVTHGGANANVQQALLKAGTAIPSSALNSYLCAGPRSGTGSYANIVGVFPIFSFMGYAANPDGVGVAYFKNDIPGGGNVIPVTIFGQTHNYVTCGENPNTSINGNSAVSGLMIRWE